MFASRTRRAMSWAYCAPKSTTSTGLACNRVAGTSTRSPSGASTRSSSWAWVMSVEVSAVSPAGVSLTVARLPAGGGQLTLDLGRDLALGPERQERHHAGQHHQHHASQRPTHLEPQVGRRHEVDHVDEPVRLRPPGQRVVAEAVVQHDLEDEQQQPDTDDEGHHLEELQRLLGGLDVLDLTHGVAHAVLSSTRVGSRSSRASRSRCASSRTILNHMNTAKPAKTHHCSAYVALRHFRPPVTSGGGTCSTPGVAGTPAPVGVRSPWAKTKAL